MNPYDAAHQLARALKDSSEYRSLLTARQNLEADPSALEMVNDLRKQQLEMQRQQLSGIEVSQEQLDKLEKVTEIVQMNMTAAAFLKAEQRFAVLMSDIQRILAGAVAELLVENQADGDND